MSRGITNIFVLAADQAVASSATPVAATGMTIPIAANQRMVVRFFGYFTVGATGGVRAQLTVPTGGTAYRNAVTLTNTATDAIVAEYQNASAAFANALANAATHFLVFEAYVENGATAGNVAITFAQNTSDVLPVTLLEGSSMVTTAY